MKHPPYHLRVNKAVDRFLLIELLRTIGTLAPPLSDFTYYGFGGPFLEDLKLLDEYLPDIKLVSVEANSHTRQRQEFHRFSSRLTLYPDPPGRPGTLNDFLTAKYTPGKRDIFWLDYTDLSYSRIQEFQRVMGVIPVGSIIRITLRAELDYAPWNYSKFLDANVYSQLVTKIKEDFDRIYGTVLQNSAEDIILDRDKFPSVILGILKGAAEHVSLEARDRELVPVHSVVYSDHTRMLTFTGVLVEYGKTAEFRETYKAVPFATFDWDRIHPIELPVLSLREVMALGRHLPRDSADLGSILFKCLGYRVANTDKSTEAALASHAQFHRYHPQFVRMAG